jgi:prolyl 4-hydroxylase
MPSVSGAAQVEQLVSAGRFAEAANQLISAAEAGDAEALFALATWRISGHIVRRDTAAARELMGKAAHAGHREATRLYAHFLANRTGGPADWKKGREVLESLRGTDPAADEQFAMLERMAVKEDGNPEEPPRLETLSQSPLILTASAFLNDEECDYLVRKGEPRLRPSTVIERATGRSIYHPVRRSDGMHFGVATEDLVVNAINRRIAAASGTAPEQGEPLQLLRYRSGGEFKPHHDAEMEGGNQRILTALVYLSDGYEGGETRFMRVGLDFRGRKGDLLLFRNVTAEGQPDQLAEHAGLPVTKGTKIVASRWIWREPPVFPPPQSILPNV